MAYPSSLDAFNNPTAADNLDTPGVLHATQHTDINNAVESLEAKVGINGSAVTTSLDYRTTVLETKTTPTANVTVGAAGTGATYTTIQAALDALTSGGVINLLAGTYTITSTLLFKYPDTTIQGVYSSSIIACNGASVATAIKANTTGLARCGVQNVKFSQTNGSTLGTAVDLTDMALFRLERVVIDNFSTGINMGDTVNTTFYNVCRDVQITTANTGINITPTNPVNMNLFENIRIAVKASGTGLNITQGQGNTFINLDCEPASVTGTTGIALGNAGTGVTDTTFLGVWVEGNNLGLSVNANVLRTKFFGGNIGYNNTNITDNSSSTEYFAIRQQDSLKHDLVGVRLPVINGSTLNGLEIYLNSSTATNRGIRIVNDINFAHSGDPYYGELVNLTDTGNIFHAKQAGSGFTFLGQDAAANNTFTVSSTGNIRSLGSIVGKQSTLVDAATVAINAALGNSFYLAASGNRTLGIPTNPTEGQEIVICIFAAGGSNRTISLTTSGVGSFRFNTTIASLTATVSATNDYLRARYNSTDAKWDLISYTKG